MKRVLLYCLSDARNKNKAAVNIRDCLAENLVNESINSQAIPSKMSRFADGDEITLYESGSTGGGIFNNRPYTNVHNFLDEFQSVTGFDLNRVARFQNNNYKYPNQNNIQKNDSRKKLLSLVEKLMKRVNKLDLEKDERLPGKIFDNLSFRVISNRNLVEGVDSHIYSMTPDADFTEYRKNKGPWIVYKNSSFDRSPEDLLYNESYCFDCTNNYPIPISLEELESENGFVVEAETRY